MDEHGREFGHFVNGKWYKPDGRKYYTTIAPSTGKELCKTIQGNDEDVNYAVGCAKKVGPSPALDPELDRLPGLSLGAMSHPIQFLVLRRSSSVRCPFGLTAVPLFFPTPVPPQGARVVGEPRAARPGPAPVQPGPARAEARAPDRRGRGA